MSVRLKLVFGK